VHRKYRRGFYQAFYACAGGGNDRADPADSARVLVLTLFEEDATVLTAVRAGASGYLVKGSAAIKY
jgi:hypothetical protein